jgi:hypothetical protein
MNHLIVSAMVIAMIGGCMRQSASDEQARDTRARPLDLSQWIRDERVIGLGALLPAEVGPAVFVPRRATLWKLGRLSVPPPEGRPMADPGRRDAALADLRTRTGAAWLTVPVASNLEVIDHLASPELQRQLESSGAQVTWDDPQQGYYRVAAEVEGRHVQCTGQIGQWLACFVAMPLTREQALDGNRVRPRPLDAKDVITPVLPRAAALPWKPRDAGVPEHVIDTFLEAPGVQLWAGVRARGPQGQGETLLYGVRVNLE